MTDFETAKHLFLEGLQFLEANDLHSAEARFARSLEILPGRVSTLNNLAAIKLKLHKLHKFTEAEELARKAAALEDNSPEAWSNLALALTATDRHDEALQFRSCHGLVGTSHDIAAAHALRRSIGGL